MPSARFTLVFLQVSAAKTQGGNCRYFIDVQITIELRSTGTNQLMTNKPMNQTGGKL